MPNKSPVPLLVVMLIVAAFLFACQHRDEWQEAYYHTRPDHPSMVGK